jgi:hypothetical protein
MNLKRPRNIHAEMPIRAASSASLVATASTVTPTPGAPIPHCRHPNGWSYRGWNGRCRTGTTPVDPLADCAPQKDAVIAMIGRQIRRPCSLIIQVKYGTFAEIDRYIRGLIQSER